MEMENKYASKGVGGTALGLAIGIPCDLNSLVDKTVYQIFNLLDRYSLYYNYDLDVRCKLAGSTEETEVENWMKIQ